MAKAKKMNRGIKKESHTGGGTKTYAVSKGHIIESWIPPTAYCGVKVEGYVSFTPGLGTDQWPGPISCGDCMEGVK